MWVGQWHLSHKYEILIDANIFMSVCIPLCSGVTLLFLVCHSSVYCTIIYRPWFLSICRNFSFSFPVSSLY